MIYSVDFKYFAGKINPLELCKYLKDIGWEEFKFQHEQLNLKIFQLHDENGSFKNQVKVPMNRNFVDFSESMLQACKEIANSQNKSLEQTVLELLNPMSDIIRVRIENENIKDGSILFEDALNLYENAKKLITTTAMSIYNNQDDFHGKLPETVQTFIDRCRYGQTEIGSYVISVVCPFYKITSEGPLQLSIFNEEEESANSITRKITSKLIKDLNNVKKNIDNGMDLDLLIKAKDDSKINVNFLDAIKNLNLQNENTLLEITTKWAPTIQQNRVPEETVFFTHDYYEIIRTKVDIYRSRKDEGRVELIGQIKGLDANPVEEERDYGEIKVVALIKNTNKTKNIKIRLRKEDYYLAIDAHKRGAYVKIVGEYDKKNASILICKEYEEII